MRQVLMGFSKLPGNLHSLGRREDTQSLKHQAPVKKRPKACSWNEAFGRQPECWRGGTVNVHSRRGGGHLGR